jgi:hypothetical protein
VLIFMDNHFSDPLLPPTIGGGMFSGPGGVGAPPVLTTEKGVLDHGT